MLNHKSLGVTLYFYAHEKKNITHDKFILNKCFNLKYVSLNKT